MEDKVTSLRVRESTRDKLKIYRNTYGSYERAILELIKNFEGGNS